MPERTSCREWAPVLPFPTPADRPPRIPETFKTYSSRQGLSPACASTAAAGCRNRTLTPFGASDRPNRGRQPVPSEDLHTTSTAST
jgi:hypothetical protein